MCLSKFLNPQKQSVVIVRTQKYKSKIKSLNIFSNLKYQKKKNASQEQRNQNALRINSTTKLKSQDILSRKSTFFRYDL